MNFARWFIAGWLLSATAWMSGSLLAQDAFLSPLALVAAPDGSRIYIALKTGRQVMAYERGPAKVAGGVALEQPVGGMCISKDGKIIYVAETGVAGRIAIIDSGTLAVTGRLEAGHYPGALTLNRSGEILYVCSRYADTVSAFSLAEGKAIHTVKAMRQPSALALTADGQHLLVTNFLPAGAADGDYAAAMVTVLKADGLEVVRQIQLPNGSHSLNDIALSADGRFAYVTHIISRYQLPTTQLDRGWMNTNAMSVLDLTQLKLVNSVLLDDVDLGAANPWGVTLANEDKTVAVALAGNHEVCLIDRAGLHDRLDKAARGERVTSVTSSADYVMNDLSFLVGIKQRVSLKGLGPRGMLALGDTLYLAEYFSDSLGVVKLAGNRPQADSIALGAPGEMTAVRQGEIFFHDSSLCFQKWQSCASCHPDDGRIDGLNWDLLNDGLGNPKNTKSMLLAHQTPPAMSLGVRDKAETAVRAGIRFIQFAVRPEADAQAIDDYLKALQPVPSPWLAEGKLSESAQRGKDIYAKAGCMACHGGDYYTNLKSYDVGTGKYREADKPLDTPSLVELWRTAPYLHDGRATTIGQVLKTYNAGDKHGRTSQLSETELQDLEVYLLSL